MWEISHHGEYFHSGSPSNLPRTKKEERSLQDVGLEKVPGNLSVRSLTSNVNAYKLVTLYALYIHAKLFSLVLWLLRFSLSRAFHNAACPFKAHSRLMYWRLWLWSSLTSKIPFDCLSSHRPFKFVCLPPATDPAWYQRRINAAGCPPPLCKWSSVICSSCSGSLWSFCD